MFITGPSLVVKPLFGSIGPAGPYAIELEGISFGLKTYTTSNKEKSTSGSAVFNANFQYPAESPLLHIPKPWYEDETGILTHDLRVVNSNLTRFADT